MTATIEDLDWVVFLDDDQDQEKCCDNKHAQCSNAAVYVCIWGPDPTAPEERQCRCGNKTLLCLPCFEFYTQGPAGQSMIFCAGCEKETGKLFFKKIVYAEPVKR